MKNQNQQSNIDLKSNNDYLQGAQNYPGNNYESGFNNANNPYLDVRNKN